MNNRKNFLDIGFYQSSKNGEYACGDIFLSARKNRGRTVCVLADGLGSGIKAHVLANLTATMALRFVSEEVEIKEAARVILTTLPVCSTRKIGFSTFTIMDISEQSGQVRIIEYENPPYCLIRNGKSVAVPKKEVKIKTEAPKPDTLYLSNFSIQRDDRILFFSDGISQAGLGTPVYPLGWGAGEAADFASGVTVRQRAIPSRQLCKILVRRARLLDGDKAKDDTTCASLFLREPRRLIIATGPPFKESNDAVLADKIRKFFGKKVLCGGTTATIISREWKEEVEVDLTLLDRKIPPPARMEGCDLITEGAITLSTVSSYLNKGLQPESIETRHAAQRLLSILIDSDSIHFIVGTRINEAHQDPNLPEELDIRRNLIRRIMADLKDKYMKDVTMEMI